MIKSVLIVDDEFHSRESLVSLLSKYCGPFDVLYQADSVTSACEILLKHTPDLLFLDIMMPDGNGFDILEAFPERAFKVIFITAYDSFAIKAFRFAAIDYILKPVSIALLKDSVGRFERVTSQTSDNISLHAADYYFTTHRFDRIVIPAQEGYLFVSVTDIIAIEADSNYSVIHRVGDKPLLAAKTLLEFETTLQHQNFYRIHHSYLINLNHVIRYKHKENAVEMSDGKLYVVSSRKKTSFNEFCRLVAVDAKCRQKQNVNSGTIT